MENQLIKLYGTITDFKGNPLTSADVMILSREFEPIYKTVTNEKGQYEMNVKPGIYASFYACKDYAVNNLEYWAWNVPIFKEMQLNAEIDGLEVYAINGFQVQGASPNRVMLYFRPMSLKKGKSLMESGKLDTVDIFNMAPKLTNDDIDMVINDEKVEVFQINRVLEDVENNQKQTAYLIHVQLPENLNIYEYNKITITLYDNETNERGQGSLFWKADKLI